jgi:hypothetical protein
VCDGSLTRDGLHRRPERPRRYRDSVLVEPAQSLTDGLLAVVAIGLASQLVSPTVSRHWRTAFWWFGVAALAGAVHHGVIVRWARAGDVSWAVISLVVVLAVSYLLAATVAEVLGPGRARAFWLLRSIGIVAYATAAATGHAGIGAMLACEGLTMLSVLGLWLWAARGGHPLAPPMLVAIAASIAAAVVKIPGAEVVRPLGLDGSSAYHLAQIAGIVLLYLALTGRAGERTGTSTHRLAQEPARTHL